MSKERFEELVNSCGIEVGIEMYCSEESFEELDYDDFC